MKKVLTLLLLSLFLLASCSSKSTPVTGNAAWNGETKEITVRAFRFGFEPDTIEVNKGDKIKLTAYSSDGHHSFTLYDFDVNLDLEGSDKKTAEFIADKAGTFTFFCALPCGKGHGQMRGNFVVKE